jgi:4-hydroxy-2-oxoheptanedioate aldolase
MRNNVRAAWAKGQAAVNGWLWFPDSFAAEILAAQGFDSVTVDMQHGLIDRGDSVALLQAIATQNVTALARVQANIPGDIMKLLDAGALGIICPMVSTRAEAEAFVAACRYPPQGNRSFGPSACITRYGADYVERANDQVLAFAMIETREALANLDDILSVPGLDGVYVGPNDLALSLGYPASQDSTEKEIVDAIATIAAKAHQHGVVPGIACPSGAVARKRIAQGFRFVTPGNQAALMAAAAKAAVAEARAG